MADLREIVSHLNNELRTDEIKDFTGAHNGLQLTNSGEIIRIVAAVDTSLAVIQEAARVKNTLLIVHHGMFWQGVKPIDGPFYQKLKTAIDADLAVYSSHLPLDVHPVFGNNILLAQAIGLTDIEPILERNGFPSGVAGRWEGAAEGLKTQVERAVSRGSVMCGDSAKLIEKVAVMTGGAGSAVGDMVSLGVDAFVTGEGPHWSYIESEEQDIITIYAGHYATEVFGVRKLAADVAEKFGCKNLFIHRDGGL